MSQDFAAHVAAELEGIRDSGLFKTERVIATPQGAYVRVGDGQPVLNLCANNYLGLAQHPAVRAAASQALEDWGFGLASVRFICGTQGLHKQLETALSQWLGFEDTILYPSCFDANGGLFETLLGPEDAVISDALNHASIIDGVRLCKAQRYRYANCDMAELEAQLQKADAAGARFKLITTDGVFSMDGTIAPLDQICALARRYGALVHVDDSHATGFVGPTGRGTHEHCGVMGQVDILTGTLGKALGGASGGFTSASSDVVALLRQRSRPYLFSNTVAPAAVGGSIEAIRQCQQGELLEQLRRNSQRFRQGMTELGYELKPGEHPIIPVMLHEAPKAARLAERLLELGLYVIAFSYPVVPKGAARIRTQMSAALSDADIDFALEAFAQAREVL
ncbi:MAG: glycine C-acetyltransferase [Oceanococcaceae bacterium]